MELPEAVPVMTLPSATLFPQALLPLYIFETRYRQMLADMLRGGRPGANSRLRGPRRRHVAPDPARAGPRRTHRYRADQAVSRRADPPPGQDGARQRGHRRAAGQGPRTGRGAAPTRAVPISLFDVHAVGRRRRQEAERLDAELHAQGDTRLPGIPPGRRPGGRPRFLRPSPGRCRAPDHSRNRPGRAAAAASHPLFDGRNPPLPQGSPGMSPPTQSPTADERDEIHAALFAQMVMQQSSLALMFLGVTPHPETGKKLFDLDSAQMFIAQLDMLEAKTRGNLSADEAALLKQSLTTVRMAFVQAVNSGDPSKASEESAPASAPGAQSAPAPQATPKVEASPAPEPNPIEDERKKFVKKY